jgi:SAM-dependent methyltransferase
MIRLRFNKEATMPHPASLLRQLTAISIAFALCVIPAARVLAAQYEAGGDVPYVPTPPEVVEAMLKLADVKSTDFVVDLGCGDGRIVVMAAEKFGAHARGVDLNPVRIQEAEANAKKAGVTERVKFVQGNLFDAEVKDASVVTLYLLPDVNLKLRPKLLKDLKVGTRIVSHSFDMGDWQPDKKIELGWRRVYLWTVTEQAKATYGGQMDSSAGAH